MDGNSHEQKQPSKPTPSEPPSSPDASEVGGISLTKPCRIVNVRFEGVHRTRPHLLSRIVADIFSANSVSDLIDRTTSVKGKLDTLNAFTDVEIDLSPAPKESNVHDELEKYEVTFKVRERGRIITTIHTAVDEQSSHLDIGLTTPNLSGLGDSISMIGKFNKRLYSGECRYSVPITPWRSLWAPNYSLNLCRYQWDSLPTGHDQDDISIVNQVRFYSLPELQHAISFENIWRNIRCSSPRNTPIILREQCGHSVKSSIKHVLTWDNRDRSNFPSEGILGRLSNEFAFSLVNGGARFTRHEASLQLNALLLPKYDFLCQVNFMAGTLLKPQRINICDKFFAGGPLTIRGFSFNGLAPTVDRHPLGDASFLSAGVHIYPIFPYTKPESKINQLVRPHVFFNTGTIGDIHDTGRLTSKDDMRREAIRFRNSLRHSFGFGFVAYFLSIRLEVNYCIPLVFKNGDIHSQGVQWGFGMNFT